MLSILPDDDDDDWLWKLGYSPRLLWSEDKLQSFSTFSSMNIELAGKQTNITLHHIIDGNLCGVWMAICVVSWWQYVWCVNGNMCGVWMAICMVCGWQYMWCVDGSMCDVWLAICVVCGCRVYARCIIKLYLDVWMLHYQTMKRISNQW